jgi:hypothetical protein
VTQAVREVLTAFAALSPEEPQLVTLYPDEPEKSHQAFFANSEFEAPSPSLL